MKKATQKAIDAAIAKYKADIIKELTEAAPKAHIAGDLAALNKLKPIAVDFKLVQAEALSYSKKYSKDLYTKGGSVINGKFVSWLKDSSAQKRQNIAKIISDGIKAGKPTTAIGGKRLGKGTIAYDLAKECSDKGDGWAQKVARTEASRIQMQGSMSRYAEQDIESVKYLCSSDPCPICAVDCQKTFKLSEAPEIPRHPQCRCDYAPIVSREKRDIQQMNDKEIADTLWKDTAKDGKEHAIIRNGIPSFQTSGKSNVVDIKNIPERPFNLYHSHPEWDSPLSGGDLGFFISHPNNKEMVAASEKFIYKAIRTSKTETFESRLLFRFFNDNFKTRMDMEFVKLHNLQPTRKHNDILREAAINAGKSIAKDYKFKYEVIPR